MRHVIFGSANSLDNYLARPDHSVDWLQWSDEVADAMTEFWPRIDAVLMGRKTYEATAALGQAPETPGVTR